MHQVSRWKDPTLLLIFFHTQLFTFIVSLITVEYTFVFNSWYLILFTNSCILNYAFPSKTGSLSLILESFFFNYLLDDLARLWLLKKKYKKEGKKTPQVRTCTFEKKTNLTRSSWKMPKDNCDSRVHLMIVTHANSLGFILNPRMDFVI